MELKQALLKQYQFCLEGRTTKEIVKAEKQINALQTDPQFLKYNIDIIMQLSLPINLRKLASVQLSHYSKRLQQEYKQEKINELLMEIFLMFEQKQLEDELKVLMVNSAVELLQVKESKEIRENFIVQAGVQMELMEKKGGQYNFSYVGLCCQVLLKLRESVRKVNYLITNYFIRYLKIGNELLKHISLTSQSEAHFLSSKYSLAEKYAKVITEMINRMRLLDDSSIELILMPEMSQFVMRGFDLNHKSNKLDTPLLIVSDFIELTSSFNSFKIALNILLQIFMRTSNCLLLEKIKLKQCHLIQGGYKILEETIRALTSMLSSRDIIALPLRFKILQGIQMLLKLLICGLRMTETYYYLFLNSKRQINEQIIMKCLYLTQKQVQDFEDNPEEFVQNAIYVVNRDERQVLKDKMVDQAQGQDQEKSLKAVAADCLVTLCLHQDGAVTNLFDFALEVLKGQIKSDYPHYILYQVMTIMSESLKTRPDLRNKVVELITVTSSQLIDPLLLPVSNLINYTYYLLFVSFTVKFLDQMPSTFYSSILQQASITVESGKKALQYIAYEVIETISEMNIEEKLTFDILLFYGKLMKRQVPSLVFLQSFQKIFRTHRSFLKEKKQLVINAVELIGAHMVEQFKQNATDRHFVHLCFNIVNLIGGENDYFPWVIMPIQQALHPLIPFISGKTDFDFEQDILCLLRNFICFKQNVSHLEEDMLRIIPEIYYGQYIECFGQAFETIQILAYYGSSILKQNEKSLMALLQIGLNSMSHPLTDNHTEVDSCEGVVTLQSLILSCGDALCPAFWSKMIEEVMNRLNRKNTYNFLTANLLGLLALILTQCEEQIKDDQGENILFKLLNNYSAFRNVDYAQKLMLACLSKLITKSRRKFIVDNFQSILKTIIKLLSESSFQSNKSALFDEESEEQEESYCKMLKKVKNSIKQLDEFVFFKEHLNRWKGQDRLKAVFDQLEQSQRNFIGNMLRTERIGNAQHTPRIIYRAKRQ